MGDLLSIDKTRLYFGKPFYTRSGIEILHPKIGQIIDYGEEQYFQMVHQLTSIPSDAKSVLDDMGLDWMEVPDFDYFVMMTRTLTPEQTGILLGDLDLSSLKPYRHPQIEDEIILADKDSGVVLDRVGYLELVNFLRTIHNLKPKIERAANKITHKVLIDEDRTRRRLNADKPYEPFLLPLISAVKVRQGYTLEYLENQFIYEFFDDLNRLNAIISADALLAGCYSGGIDMTKINKKELDWLRDLST